MFKGVVKRSGTADFDWRKWRTGRAAEGLNRILRRCPRFSSRPSTARSTSTSSLSSSSPANGQCLGLLLLLVLGENSAHHRPLLRSTPHPEPQRENFLWHFCSLVKNSRSTPVQNVNILGQLLLQKMSHLSVVKILEVRAAVVTNLPRRALQRVPPCAVLRQGSLEVHPKRAK